MKHQRTTMEQMRAGTVRRTLRMLPWIQQIAIRIIEKAMKSLALGACSTLTAAVGAVAAGCPTTTTLFCIINFRRASIQLVSCLLHIPLACIVNARYCIKWH